MPSRVRPQGRRNAGHASRRCSRGFKHVLSSGCACRQLPPRFPVSESTAHRRFLTWSPSGLCGPREAGFQDAHLVGREWTPPPPRLSAGNTHDSDGLKPMVEGQRRYDPDRGRISSPAAACGEGPHCTDLCQWLRGNRIGVRIARKDIDSSGRSGGRWVIERTCPG